MVGSLIGLDWPNSPYLAKLIQDPLVRVNRAYELTRELLRRISLNRPTILLLDDLHWADEDSLDLLAYLIEAEINDAGLPLLILAAAQPEFLDHQQRLAKHCQMVWLNPLPTMADTVAKAYTDLRALPDAVLSSLAKYSTGNPYFLEEIIRGLLLAEGEDGENALSEALARLHTQPPESLNAILRSRLTDLTRMARATAMLSSVSGRVFWVGAIEAAIRAVAEKTTDLHLTLPYALDERSIQEGLGLLVKAELAFPRANSTYSSVQEYIFKHDLLRDIAYSLIPADFRRQYHQAVGQWMMGHDDLDFMIMAADQFEMAGAVADAISACEQAASRNEARGALGEAHMLIERARMIRDRGG